MIVSILKPNFHFWSWTQNVGGKQHFKWDRTEQKDVFFSKQKWNKNSFSFSFGFIFILFLFSDLDPVVDVAEKAEADGDGGKAWEGSRTAASCHRLLNGIWNLKIKSRF